MKTVFFVVGLIALLQACALGPSPYIAECTQPECEQKAIEKPLAPGSKDGIRVVTNTDISFSIASTPQDLVHQKDMLIIIFPDGTKIASAILSVSDFGIESSELSAHALLDLAFMKKFSLLPDRLSRAERHVIRSIKVDAMSNGEPVRYANEKITIYFYSESDIKHKAYVVSGRNTSSWSMLDFYGLTAGGAKELLSTIEPF